LRRSEAELRRLEATLSTDEAGRAARFVSRRDRDDFVASRGIQREILSRYLLLPPATLAFRYSEHGKPSLDPAVASSAIRFNISNSGGIALYAVALDREVGVDIEAYRPVRDALALARRYFAPEEYDALRDTPASLQERAFLTCWSRKEACIKAAGERIPLGLRRFVTGALPNALPLRVHGHSANGPGQPWTVQSVAVGERHIGALAIEDGLARLHWYDRDL
jgi:4'-phosphopantetheinyl transferase